MVFCLACDSLNSNENEVQVTQDLEMKQDVIEIFGPEAQMEIVCETHLEHLVLYLRGMDRFLKLELFLVDVGGERYHITASNKFTISNVNHNQATVPLSLGKGFEGNRCVSWLRVISLLV